MSSETERKAGGGDHRPLAALLRGSPQAQLQGEFACGHHADRHGLAVQEAAVIRRGLDGVAKGMTEIQNCAYAGFAFVLE